MYSEIGDNHAYPAAANEFPENGNPQFDMDAQVHTHI
jgi:hypothetical protein